MQDGAVGDTFNVSGNYDAIGAGNALKIDADFAADKADELQVGGAISGVTDLNVADVTPAAAAATGEDVLVAQAGGGVDAANFSLVGGPIVKGIWDYGLANGAAADTVVLRGSLNSLAALYSATAGALADAFGELPTLEERVGQRQWLTRNDDSFFEGVWVRFAGKRMTKTPEASSIDFSTRSSAWGVQVGADFALFGNEAGLLTAGITGQYKGMDAKVSRPTSDDQGKISADGGGGGLNLTWNGARGEYVDLQGQYNQASTTLGTTRLGDTVTDLDVESTQSASARWCRRCR
jgi:outer membrane autotransporter protein